MICSFVIRGCQTIYTTTFDVHSTAVVCDLQQGTHHGEQVETLAAARTFYKAIVPS